MELFSLVMEMHLSILKKKKRRKKKKVFKSVEGSSVYYKSVLCVMEK